MTKEQKQPVGRPTLYDPIMIEAVKTYIEECPNKIPSLAGLSLVLDISKRTLLYWKSLDPNEIDPEKYPDFEEFLHQLDRLSAFQEIIVLEQGLNGDWNSHICKLILHQHGYNDSQNLNLAGQTENRTPITVITFKPEDYHNDSNSEKNR